MSTFQICAGTGLLLGTSLSLTLAASLGLSLAVIGLLLAIGVLVFIGLAMATKVLTGHETLVYYHHEIAILSTAALVLSALDLPVHPYLDVTALGLGLILACGRVGCLMVGCCHGRPHHWGVCYGHDHAREGFPEALVGARLFPIQAVESFFVVLVVATGSWFLVRGTPPPGAVLSWYVVGYSAARVCFEEFRGDSARPYWRGLSEAQWTSLALMVVVVLGEWRGRLPFSWWHTEMLAIAALGAIALAVRRGPGRHPGTVGELAAFVKSAAESPRTLTVRRMSTGIGVSSDLFGDRGELTRTFSLSRSGRPLEARDAHRLAGEILNLVPVLGRSYSLLRGGHGVFHMIIYNARPPSSRVVQDNPGQPLLDGVEP